jgi:hypothetical protein
MKHMKVRLVLCMLIVIIIIHVAPTIIYIFEIIARMHVDLL